MNGVDMSIVKSEEENSASSSHEHSSLRSTSCGHGADTRPGTLQPIALSGFISCIFALFPA